MSSVFEALMIICFGISWPLSVIKILQTKSIEGKSTGFVVLILSGYVFGILGKVLSNSINYVVVFYVINLVVVSFELYLHIHYKNKLKN
ncbi:hypothetical protein ERUR111494_03670 [Erysipelothrix urinaevulpis]|uniref:hypothetical protein n=1 Tax=Erysipelothrix urinaevulpis TaxID=2683717 RepID=UPI00135B9AF0|nr:hypothetical protein [Erysipelothrix urinaevulpis]